jgi:hypothetical protein
MDSISYRCLLRSILFAAAFAVALMPDRAAADPPVHRSENLLPDLEAGLTPLFVLGDLNEDGIVDEKDRDLLAKIVAAPGVPSPAAATCVAAGDLDFNQVLDQRDLKRLDSWLEGGHRLRVPALGYQPSLPCEFKHLFVAVLLDAPLGTPVPIRFLEPGVSAKNAKVRIQSGPATVRPDGRGYLVQTTSAAKPGDEIVLLITLPKAREYLYSYQIEPWPIPPR